MLGYLVLIIIISIIGIILRFSFSVYALVFVSIESIYHTLETVFNAISIDLECRQEYFASRRTCIFNSLLSLWKSDETLSLVFDILQDSYLFSTVVL